jgi:hypothetical protein
VEDPLMRLILLIAVVLLAIDALYYDGAHTQAGAREITAAVTSLTAGIRDESEFPAEFDAAPMTPTDEPSTGR